MARIGRLKYGAARFQEMSSTGRRRAAAARKVGKKPEKTFAEGGGATFAAGVRMIRKGQTRRLGKLLSAKSPSAKARIARG